MLKYKICAIKNQQEQKTKYYPGIVYSGTLTRNQLCERISAKTTLTRADVLCVVIALEEAIAEKLANSCNVRLGDLGSFSSSIRANEGVANKEEVDATKIKKVRVIFHASSELKKRMKDEAEFSLMK